MPVEKTHPMSVAALRTYFSRHGTDGGRTVIVRTSVAVAGEGMTRKLITGKLTWRGPVADKNATGSTQMLNDDLSWRGVYPTTHKLVVALAGDLPPNYRYMHDKRAVYIYGDGNKWIITNGELVQPDLMIWYISDPIPYTDEEYQRTLSVAAVKDHAAHHELYHGNNSINDLAMRTPTMPISPTNSVACSGDTCLTNFTNGRSPSGPYPLGTSPDSPMLGSPVVGRGLTVSPSRRPRADYPLKAGSSPPATPATASASPLLPAFAGGPLPYTSPTLRAVNEHLPQSAADFNRSISRYVQPLPTTALLSPTTSPLNPVPTSAPINGATSGRYTSTSPTRGRRGASPSSPRNRAVSGPSVPSNGQSYYDKSPTPARTYSLEAATPASLRAASSPSRASSPTRTYELIAATPSSLRALATPLVKPDSHLSPAPVNYTPSPVGSSYSAPSSSTYTPWSMSPTSTKSLLSSFAGPVPFGTPVATAPAPAPETYDTKYNSPGVDDIAPPAFNPDGSIPYYTPPLGTPGTPPYQMSSTTRQNVDIVEVVNDSDLSKVTTMVVRSILSTKQVTVLIKERYDDIALTPDNRDNEILNLLIQQATWLGFDRTKGKLRPEQTYVEAASPTTYTLLESIKKHITGDNVYYILSATHLDLYRLDLVSGKYQHVHIHHPQNYNNFWIWYVITDKVDRPPDNVTLA